VSPARRIALVVLFAVLGIAVAAAITWGTSQLVRQRIGLASEPLTAGQRLLPSSLTRAPRPRVTTPGAKTTTVTTTVPVAPPPAPTIATTPTIATPTTSTGVPVESAPPSPGGSGSDSTDSAKRDD